MYPQIRTGAFQYFPELVEELNGDIDWIWTQSGFDTRLLEGKDNLIPTEQYIHCLRLASATTGHSDFGLLLSTRQSVDMLGAVGLLAEAEDLLGGSVDTIGRFLRLHNSSSIVTVQQYSDKVLLTYDDIAPRFTRDPQICDFAMGFATKLARESLGEGWNPMAVYFVHKEPENLESFSEIFRCPLYFNQEFYGVAIENMALQAVQPKADKSKRVSLLQHLEQMQQQVSANEKYANLVGYLIHVLLPNGGCSEDNVAKLLQMNKRTLQRRLLDEDTSYKTILNSIRMDLARQYLLETKISLTNMASYLGYSELSAFSRFFRSQQGCSPMDYRKTGK
ncbi:MAG: AraC family transcriptional regulator [Candidatus Pelagadaptatus aseana]|uniref:AraC family transcriptional regulator n=1 Tax=Candidatus Pelagadaptatus aseana TaxID=3120508 RepID=UPI0039B2106A